MTGKKDETKDPAPAGETKQPWKHKTSEPLAIPHKNVDKRKDLLEKMKNVKPKA